MVTIAVFMGSRTDCGWAACQAAMDNERESACANLAFRAAIDSDRGRFRHIPQVARIATKRCPPAPARAEQTRPHNRTAREGHMRKNLLLAAATLLLATAPANAQTRTTLDIYVVDVEGGNATLLVTPSGESLLIDTGNTGPQASVRDASRIMEAAKDAGLTQIDHLITTHWHGDHYGGMEELAKRIPIKHFIDHGPNQQPAPGPDEFLAKVYPQLIAKAKHTVAKPGDKIPIKDLDVQVVTSAGETIKTPLAGAGKPNPYCASFKPGENNIEDPLSVGVHITFGKFRTMHLGDLTKNKEFELMCPNNRIGTIDLFLGLHHGVNTSSSEVMMHAVRPRVAIINNGTRKGGQPDVIKVLLSSPG